MEFVECASCNAPLSCLKWCKACKRVAYCNKECQRKDWKNHRSKCTHKYLQRMIQVESKMKMLKGITTAERISAKNIPFNSIHASLFSRNKFIHYLHQCNHHLLSEFSQIIYSILTGYQYTIHTCKLFPKHTYACIKNKIELYFDSGANPKMNLQNHTWFSIGDMESVLKKGAKETAKGCEECTEFTYKLLDKVQCYADETIEDKQTAFVTMIRSCYWLKMPKHFGYHWDGFACYYIKYVRDTSDDSISILLETFPTETCDLMDADTVINHFTYSLASFRCNQIMPYFDGVHYAYLLKGVLDYYEFDAKYYPKIKRAGFSWSITNDIKLKKEYIATVRKIFGKNIKTTDDFYLPTWH
eukprot:230516_1